MMVELVGRQRHEVLPVKDTRSCLTCRLQGRVAACGRLLRTRGRVGGDDQCLTARFHRDQVFLWLVWIEMLQKSRGSTRFVVLVVLRLAGKSVFLLCDCDGRTMKVSGQNDVLVRRSSRG